jgi:hypothetical protein
MMPEAVQTLDWTAFAGGGAVVSVLFLALVERLRRTFATRQELNGLGQKFNALENLYIQARDAADEAHDRVVSLEREQKHQWERIAELVIRPLEKITDKLEVVGEAQAAHAEALDHIVQRLDRIDSTPNPRTRRQA